MYSYSVEFVEFKEQTDEDSEETTLSPVVTLYGHITGITALAFSPNGMMLASGCTRGWLNIWSLSVSIGFSMVSTLLCIHLHHEN